MTNVEQAKQCTICHSWWPEICPCAQALKKMQRYFNCQNAGPDFELQCREVLANGVPHDMPACEYHKTMLHDLAIRDKAVDVSSTVASAPGVFEESVTDGSALLPMCNDCGVKDGVLANTPQGLMVVQDKDNCSCASTIVSSDCAFCEVGRLDMVKELAISKRTKPALFIPGDSEYLECDCGGMPFLPELVRKCTGCSGVKAVPFLNFAGIGLTFMIGTSEILNKLDLPFKPSPVQILPASQTLMLPPPPPRRRPGNEGQQVGEEEQQAASYGYDQQYQQHQSRDYIANGNHDGTAYGAAAGSSQEWGGIEGVEFTNIPVGPPIAGALDADDQNFGDTLRYWNSLHAWNGDYVGPPPPPSIRQRLEAMGLHATDDMLDDQLMGAEQRAARVLTSNPYVRLTREQIASVLEMFGLSPQAVQAIMAQLQTTVEDASPKAASVVSAMMDVGMLGV